MLTTPWKKRAQEEAFLFNPAFCGALAFEFLKAYTTAKDDAAAYPLVFCALPMALHPATRGALPATTANSLYTWIEDNPAALIGYPERARLLVPFVQECLRFAMDRQVIALDEAGGLAPGKKTAAFTPTVLQELTAETKACVNTSRQIGRWFAKAGAPSTILSALQVTL
jgi:hypothetical protein